MFDKKLLMSHIENETNNDKMMRAGVNTPFYGNVEEKYGKKITKSHGKNYPKGTHMCATHVEHAEWGQGTPVHGDHAAPDENGQISWYNVMFEHGVETVNTSDMKVLAEASHENHDHHAHPGENLSEEEKKLNIILKTLTGRGGEPGEKTPGRGEDPTDHHEVDGQPRQRGRFDQLARDLEARHLKTAIKNSRMFDPNIRRSEVRKDVMSRIANRMREAGDI